MALGIHALLSIKFQRQPNKDAGTIAGLVVLLLVAAILPPSRAFALNLIGVRATASVTVLDATTQLPLKNANVSLGSVTAKSDAKGQVTLSKVKLGSQQLSVITSQAPRSHLVRRSAQRLSP